MKKRNIIAIANGKGGVGKTTTTFQLAWIFAKQGMKTLVVDCDHQCNLTDAFNLSGDYESDLYKSIVENAPTIVYGINDNLGVIRSSRMLVNLDENANTDKLLILSFPNIINSYRDEFDIILLDCPPHLNSTIMRGAAYVADFVVIPINGIWSLMGQKDMQNLISKTNEDIEKYLSGKVYKTEILGYILNQARTTQKEWKKTLYELAKQRGENSIFSNIINERAYIRNTQAKKLSVCDNPHKIKGKVVKNSGIAACIEEYENVAAEIIFRANWINEGHTFEEGLPEFCQDKKFKVPTEEEINEL